MPDQANGGEDLSKNGDRYRKPIPKRDVELNSGMKSECVTRPMTPEEKWYYGVADDGDPAPPTQKGGDDVAYRKYPHVTKEFVLAEFAKNKTAAQIEREQDMPANSLYARLKSWGIRSPHSVDFKKSDQSKPEKERDRVSSPASPSVQIDVDAQKLIDLMNAAKDIVIYGQERCANQEELFMVLRLILFARNMKGGSYASTDGS